MADNNNLEDQLNILFDDAAEDADAGDAGKAEKDWDFSTLFETSAVDKKAKAAQKPALKDGENARKMSEHAKTVLDDTDISKDFEELDFSEVDSMIGSEPDIDEEESEEEPSAKGGPDEAEGMSSRPEEDESDEEKELRKESVRFWIFTAVVALVVAASVLFILYRRGIIGAQEKTASSTPVQTVVSKESSAKETSSETVTSSEKQTETATEKETSGKESVSEKESSSAESSKEESKETESTEETTTEEETSETETETETESEAGSDEGDKQKVTENYDNIFVVSGTGTLNVRKEADAESDLVATIDEFGGGSILEQKGEWYRISSGGLEGYVKAEFVKTGDEAKSLAVEHAVKQVKITADTLNVRTEADTDADILDVVNKGTVFEMIDETDGFYHVKYNYMYQGYVSKDFSSLDWYLKEAVKYYAE